MNNSNPHTVCIIGGGMSGLITGALLAKNGYKVTVLEKNHIIGGGLQSFRRGDSVFNTGMQGFAGYGDQFVLGHMFKYLGVDHNRLHIVPANEKAQEIVWIDQHHCYHLPKGKREYENYLISQFPHEKDGICKLIDEIFKIGNCFDYIAMRKPQQHAEAIDYHITPALTFIKKFISDENLLKIFEYASPHLGFNLSMVSAAEFGMILSLYIEGGFRIAGGMIAMANELKKVICENEGLVISDAEVSRLVFKERQLKYVETIKAQRYNSDIYIGAISPLNLLNMAASNGIDIYRSGAQSRVMNYINDSSCFLVHIKLKEGKVHYQNSVIFIPSIFKDTKLPKYMAFLTPPRINQNEWAETAEISCAIHYDLFTRWEHTITQNRGEEYENKKIEIANKLIEHVSIFYPEIKESIEQIYIATPLTIRDYYGNPLGATYAQQGIFIPIKTQIKNLFMSGQSVQYQGLYGVAATSIYVAETILNKSLIEEIAKA